MITTLREWREEFLLKDECPWPGPRPLTQEDDSDWLQGRDLDKTRFRQTIDGHRLVFLSGLSGVGKTSLLLQGLVPQLTASNYVVAACREWTGAADEPDTAKFVAERLHAALPAGIRRTLPSDKSLFASLDSRYGDRAVLIFDQFEELLRDAARFKSDLFSIIAEINSYTAIKVVISLRAEHLHELRDLERSAKPFTVAHYFLEEIPDAAAVEVVLAGNRREPGVVATTTARSLAMSWQEARSRGVEMARPVGLLHLQAMLYSLSHSGLDLTIDDPWSALTAEGRPAIELFESALQRSATIKLNKCRDAAAGLDDALIEGTTLALSRSVGHLSSGGFKLIREAFDLCESAMGPDLDGLERAIRRSRGGPGDPEDGGLEKRSYLALFYAVASCIVGSHSSASNRPDLLTESREDIATAAEVIAESKGWERAGWGDRLHPHAVPRDADSAEVSSGLMLGMAPAAVLIEEFRRFVFALEWLRASELVRIKTPSPSALNVTLVHDGFGAALEAWAQRYEDLPQPAVQALTAPRGADFYWRGADDSFGTPPRARDDSAQTVDGTTAEAPAWSVTIGSPLAGVDTRAVLNVRWRGAWVKAPFRHVAFLNCDFRGTVFDECRFEGVSFVNCLLDGALFSDCTIVGEASPAPGPDEWFPVAPRFEIPGGEQLAQQISRYREPGTEASVLLSQLPGNPAIGVASRPVDEVVLMLPEETGSLLIYGGRVSALTARNLRFEQSARLALRHAAGSGFDVVEHESPGHYEITGSALRHVTFTSPPTTPKGGETLTVDVTGAAIAQMWMGHDLTGTLMIENSQLAHIWNGSPDIVAKATNSRFHGLVEVDVDGSSASFKPGEEPYTLDEVDPAGEIRSRAIAMDYRRDASREPAPLEVADDDS